jgi:hypothetical protein
MRLHSLLQNVLIGTIAVLFVGGWYASGAEAADPMSAAASFVAGAPDMADSAVDIGTGEVAASGTAAEVVAALDAFAAVVRPLSHPRALEDAFRSYYAYRAAHPRAVTKPYLYFVDYGLPSTTPRGYVFDMEARALVDGPFMVAHGRGSSGTKDGVPTRFSNALGSAATSLGLYLAQETYGFRGKAGGLSYRSIGLRLKGVSAGFNDNARVRGVVAHGAPYVTASRAGRSEGCPALEEFRAGRLLPKLANGGMVFLFAPDERWMARDPWILAGGADSTTAGTVATAG